MRLPLASLRSVLAFGLLASLPALAHQPVVPPRCVEPDTTPVILFSFRFTPQALAQYRAAHSQAQGEDCPPDKSCGVVDDWFMATAMSGDYCNGPTRGIAPDPVAVEITHPADYKAGNHHDLYRFTDGDLVGSCYVCVKKPVVERSRTK